MDINDTLRFFRLLCLLLRLRLFMLFLFEFLIVRNLLEHVLIAVKHVHIRRHAAHHSRKAAHASHGIKGLLHAVRANADIVRNMDHLSCLALGTSAQIADFLVIGVVCRGIVIFCHFVTMPFYFLSKVIKALSEAFFCFLAVFLHFPCTQAASAV